MKIKALVSFSGAFAMAQGEVKECGDEAVLRDLMRAGYAEAADEGAAEKKMPKRGKANEAK